MIGLDTNVLLRLFIEDDRGQCERARRFVDEAAADEPCFVNVFVLAEFAWALAKTLKLPKSRSLRIVEGVRRPDDLEIAQRAAALTRARRPTETARLISRTICLAEINAELGCATTATFDRRRAEIDSLFLRALKTSSMPQPATPSATSLPRAAYADMFGPTTGDRMRLADTELFIEIEKDFTTYGEEVKFGGGKVIRDGMGQSQMTRRAAPSTPSSPTPSSSTIGGS